MKLVALLSIENIDELLLSLVLLEMPFETEGWMLIEAIKADVYARCLKQWAEGLSFLDWTQIIQSESQRQPVENCNRADGEHAGKVKQRNVSSK